MPKDPSDAISTVEQSLWDALERLKAGAPQNVILAKRAKRGTLKISVATVALEAGRSRTLISHDKCAYPAVRQAILALKSPAEEPPTSLAELNRRLREENAELRRTVKQARDSMAAMALRMTRVVKEAERRCAAADRRSGRRPDAQQVAGQFKDERSVRSEGKVVPLKAREPETA